MYIINPDIKCNWSFLLAKIQLKNAASLFTNYIMKNCSQKKEKV